MVSPTHGMMIRGHVSDALVRILRVRELAWIGIIRSVDSASSQDDLTAALTLHHVPYDVINGNVCVSIDTLGIAMERGLFTGFDEVWIVSGNAPGFDLSPLPHATSDGADFSSCIPGELSLGMEKANCVVILGDGCGLNYVTTTQHLQEVITKTES